MLVLFAVLGCVGHTLSAQAFLPKLQECLSGEACGIRLGGLLDMPTCRCPSEAGCKGPTWTHKGSAYRFCNEEAAASLGQCSAGDLALRKTGAFRHQLFCRCDREGLTLVSLAWNPKEDVSEYACLPREECGVSGPEGGEEGAHCRVRLTRLGPGPRVSNLRELCTCAAGQRCLEDDGEGAEVPGPDFLLRKETFSCRS